MLFRDGWKAHIAYLLWSGLQFISLLALMVTPFMAWHYARKVDRLRLGICVLAMLLWLLPAPNTSSTQTINARHINLPANCSDDDQSDDMLSNANTIPVARFGEMVRELPMFRRRRTSMASGGRRFRTETRQQSRDSCGKRCKRCSYGAEAELLAKSTG